jgi:hypothetical protein
MGELGINVSWNDYFARYKSRIVDTKIKEKTILTYH